MKVIFASALLCWTLVVNAENETETATGPEINSENMPAGDSAAETGKFNIVLAAGMTIGGDDLQPTTADRPIEAGGLIYLAAGGVYHATQNFDLQVTFGLHFDALDDRDGVIEFTRTFLELIPFYVAENGNRFGLGMTHVMSPEYSDPYMTISFEDTNGMVAEFDWMLAPHYFLGIRYADLDYTVAGSSGSIDGRYAGVIMQGHF